MCTYIDIYIYICMYIYVYIYIHMYTCIDMCISMCTCAYIYTYITPGTLVAAKSQPQRRTPVPAGWTQILLWMAWCEAGCAKNRGPYDMCACIYIYIFIYLFMLYSFMHMYMYTHIYYDVLYNTYVRENI